MKIKFSITTILFVFTISGSKAQISDSVSSRKPWVKAILPSALIISGAIIKGSEFEKNLQANIRNKVGYDYYCSIDEYFPYAPIAEMYIADLSGAKAKNHWFNQTKYLIISNFISQGITQSLKKIIPPHSFPSGHTTFAFTNATVLCNEFSQNSKVLAYSGYTFAITTGIFRMLNDQHVLSAVLAGAGIGILVTDLVYYFEPLKRFNPFKKSRNITFLPSINNKKIKFYFSYKF
jgi:hypothetical protein